MPKLLNSILLMLIVSALTAGGYFGYEKWRLHQIQSSPETMVMELARSSLNDPESARFERVTFNAKTKFGCGLVNAKNRMGGYVGFTRFVAYQPDGSVQFEPKGEESHQSTKERLDALQKQLAFLEHA